MIAPTAPEPPAGESPNPRPRPTTCTTTKFVGLAYAALILGIVGVVFARVPFLDVLSMLAAIVGIVLGAIALAGSQKIVAGIGGGLCVVAVVFTALVMSPFTAMDQTKGPVSSQLSGPSVVTPAPSVFTPAPPINQVGQQFTNLGATVTVTMVRSASSIQVNESNFRPGSGRESYTNTPAGSGASYVIVNTHVLNKAKTSMDLTCSLPIRTVLIDDQNRNFDPIHELYKIKGNPECNEELQPGFAADMTWVYRVPTDTPVLGWAFEDTTDFSTIGHNEPTVVRIQVPGA
jgi:hypothetical protein